MGLRDIKKRIVSAQNTRKLTKALKMISAIKLRRAQDSLSKMKNYSDQISVLARDLSAVAPDDYQNIFCYNEKESKSTKELLIVYGPDKAKCGPLINYLAKKIALYASESTMEVEAITVSKKLTDALKRLKIKVIDPNDAAGFPEKMNSANRLFTKVEEKILTGEYKRVSIAFPKFRSALSQEPIIEKIIPVSADAFSTVVSQGTLTANTIFEPEATSVLDHVIPESVRLRLYYAILEASASEHGARMNAMENATSNAGDMIKSLKLTYNKLRQASITKELLEITAGVESMKG